MHIGDICVSKADGFQLLDLQHDVMKDVGVISEHIYKVTTSGIHGDRPRQEVERHALSKSKARRAQAAMKHPDTVITELCDELGVTRSTLYRYVGPGGELREQGRTLLRTNSR